MPAKNSRDRLGDFKPSVYFALAGKLFLTFYAFSKAAGTFYLRGRTMVTIVPRPRSLSTTTLPL
jgi:hypothetical protein